MAPLRCRSRCMDAPVCCWLLQLSSLIQAADTACVTASRSAGRGAGCSPCRRRASTSGHSSCHAGPSAWPVEAAPAGCMAPSRIWPTNRPHHTTASLSMVSSSSIAVVTAFATTLLVVSPTAVAGGPAVAIAPTVAGVLVGGVGAEALVACGVCCWGCCVLVESGACTCGCVGVGAGSWPSFGRLVLQQMRSKGLRMSDRGPSTSGSESGPTHTQKK